MALSRIVVEDAEVHPARLVTSDISRPGSSPQFDGVRLLLIAFR